MRKYWNDDGGKCVLLLNLHDNFSFWMDVSARFVGILSKKHIFETKPDDLPIDAIDEDQLI